MYVYGSLCVCGVTSMGADVGGCHPCCYPYPLRHVSLTLGASPKASIWTWTPWDICQHISDMCDPLQNFLAQWGKVAQQEQLPGRLHRTPSDLSPGYWPALGWREGL